MKFKFQTLAIHVLLLISFFKNYGQCNQTETITICDITTIDFDSDGNPDGIINLYDELFSLTGTNITRGTWDTDARFSFFLDANTGEVSIWNLRQSTTNIDLNRYSFELFNSDCGNTPAVTVNIVLGAFSGIALPPFGINNVNVEFCDSDSFDLFEGMVSTGNIPPPHLNGEWIFLNSTNPDITRVSSGQSSEFVSIPYQPGIPIVDQAILTYQYNVLGNDNCDPIMSTTIRVSVVRQVNSGTATDQDICESTILNGDFDDDISLTDNRFLINEDIEGLWFTEDNPDTQGQISNSRDSIINLRTIYDNLIAREGLRFGLENYEFRYDVEKRSGVCRNDTTYVNFTLFEQLRPFRQTPGIPQFCGSRTESVNLFDFIEFTNEGGIDFIYDNDNYVNWRQTSGTSNINITTVAHECLPSGPTDTNPIGLHLGTINHFDVEPGIYTFEYGVSPDINYERYRACNPLFDEPGNETCGCNLPCGIEIAEITIEILPFDYAGQNTNDIELCENIGSVSLRSLLESSPEDREIITTGVWTNSLGDVIPDNFTIPTVFTIGELFNFTYTTTHPTSGCVDEATLSFTIIEEISNVAGEDAVVPVCINNRNIRLFDQLGGSPEPIGRWSGPNGYMSADHIGEFIFNDLNIPRLEAGIYTYTIDAMEACSRDTSATVTIEIVEPEVLNPEATSAIFCKIEGSVDLITLLPNTLDSTGTFTDPINTGALTGSTVTFATLSPATYDFEYTLPQTGICAPPIFAIRLTILDEVSAGSAGEDSTIQVCANGLSLNLFDQLGGTPEPTGTWTGPFGYRSFDHLGTFSATNPDIQRLANGVYTYTVGGGRCSTSTDTANVTIEIIEPTAIENNLNFTRCKSDGSLNLFSLLSSTTDRTGSFIDIENTQALSTDGRIDFLSLPQGIYNFEYSLPNEAPCMPSTLNIEIKIVDLEPPEVPFSTFCILDAKRLNDIEVNIANFNWYPSLESDEPIIDNPILLDRTTLYLANVDSENCESPRVEVLVRILNVGEIVQLEDEAGNLTERIECPLDFQDGVTPNNDSQNDRFALIKEGFYNIPEAFPQFNLKVYNRFGTEVFEGNITTSEFKGESNVPLSIGNQLPSGVYFYVFNPNFKNNNAIQGSFYLSK